MNGYGSHEFPVGGPPFAGGRASRWVHVALFGPFVLFIVWALPAGCGVSYTPLLLVAVAALILGFGAVFMACLFRLVAPPKRSGG